MMTSLMRTKDEFDSTADEDFETEGTEDEYENIDISEYVSDDDGEIADYKTRDDNYPEADDNKTVPYNVYRLHFMSICRTSLEC